MLQVRKSEPAFEGLRICRLEDTRFAGHSDGQLREPIVLKFGIDDCLPEIATHQPLRQNNDLSAGGGHEVRNDLAMSSGIQKTCAMSVESAQAAESEGDVCFVVHGTTSISMSASTRRL